MKIIKYKNNISELNKIFERSSEVYKLVIPFVEDIIQEVKKRGDDALFEFTERFDGVKLESLEVSQTEIDKAVKNSTSKFKKALLVSISNQYIFQNSLLTSKSEIIETMPGIKIWREWRPIEKVGLYVPGGRARYPSSIVMVVVPAVLAGCKEIVITSPPDKSGNIPDSTLTAMACVKNFFKDKNYDFKIRIFKVGGAQAIAGMAYGTKSIPKVYKVFGAGNSYVTAAKMLTFGEVDIDMPAGPSEVMIIADETANPDWVAADLISQCEHGKESAGVLITNSELFAKQVKDSAYQQTSDLHTGEIIKKSLRNYGACIIVKNWEDAIELVNEYAPEHLEINTENYLELKDRVINTGSIFLGKYSSEPVGDYASGSNHVLPTNGYAKMFEGLSIDAFGKQVEFQELTKEGLLNVKDAVNELASVEGLPAHANAVNIRFKS